MAFTKPNVNTPWAETGEIISPSGSKVAQGWIEEIPDFEFENWIQNRSDQFNAHVNQYGITVWDAVTQYITDKSYVQASNGVVYRAATTNTNKNPLTNSSDWSRAFNDPATIYTKTESDTKYATRANNLSDLANAATARTNLSVYSKSETDTSYAKRSNNLSDLQSSSNARSNIDVYSTGESDGRYLNESSNLSDLSNNLTARSNLDVYSKADVYTKSQTDTKYAQRSNNLSDLQSSATARSNLDVYSTGESDGRYLNEASNLSDLSNAATARTNLGVYSQAQADSSYAKKSNNLSDLANDSTARSNLGVYSTGESDSRYLNESSNLSDLTDASTARSNLGVYSKSDVYTQYQSDYRYLNESSDLSDLHSNSIARSNLDVYSKAQANSSYVGKSGDTMTGKLTLDSDPTSALHAATKQYADARGNPPGSVISFAGNILPSGYLKCNGALVSRTTYADLFGAIGTTYGFGDFSTTFRLPDLRGEFVRGWDDSRGVDSGRAFGSNQADEIRSHRHPMQEFNNDVGNTTDGPNTQNDGTMYNETGDFGGDETRPRNIALLYIIKT